MPQNNQNDTPTPSSETPDRRTLGDQQWSASYQARHRHSPGQQHRQAEKQGETSSEQS